MHQIQYTLDGSFKEFLKTTFITVKHEQSKTSSPKLSILTVEKLLKTFVFVFNRLSNIVCLLSIAYARTLSDLLEQ